MDLGQTMPAVMLAPAGDEVKPEQIAPVILFKGNI